MTFGAFALAACAAIVPPCLQAQQPLDLDFERAAVNGTGGPWGWSLGWSAFQGGSNGSFTRDSITRHGGRYSLRISLTDTVTPLAPQTILLQLPATFALGSKLHLSGWMCVQAGHAGTTRAALTLEAWKNGEFAAANTGWVGAGSASAPQRRDLAWLARRSSPVHHARNPRLGAFVVAPGGRAAVGGSQYEARRMARTRLLGLRQ